MKELIKCFMSEHQIAGLTVALTNDGKLQVAEGFGVRSEATRVPIHVHDLIRIASLAKPITAALVLRLRELDKICQYQMKQQALYILCRALLRFPNDRTQML